MHKKDKKEIPMWARTGHARPTTRREFLAAGLLPFSASLLMPNWLQLLLPANAHAAPNCPTPSSDLLPFITVNLSGGAGLSGNYVAHDEGGQMLPSYDLMGLGKTPPIEREFGNVPFAGMNNGVLISKFLEGLRATAPNALAKTAFVSICVRSRDDSPENKFAADGLIAKAGLTGSLLPNLGRRANTTVGIGQQAAVLSPPTPLIVNSFNSLSGSLGYAGALGSALKPAQKEALSRALSKLTEAQTRKLASVQSGDQVKQIVDCAGLKNEELVKMGPSVVDPRLDTEFGTQLNTLWGINNGTAANNQNLVFGSMTYNALKKNCGSVALELGGYDYHDGTRTTGDARDREAGQAIGRILESAHIMGKPVFIYVVSDGATSSEKSDNQGAPWRSDRGTAGLAFMLCYHPNGRPATSGFQLGHYTSGQVADEKSLSATPETAAIAAFANYLVLNKRMDLFSPLVGRVFDPSQVDKIIKFG